MEYMIFQGNSGKCYNVEKTKFAGGGEGTIHRIYGDDERVAKIFREDKRTDEREGKVRCMVRMQLTKDQLDDVTWPLDVIYDQNGFAGYIMPVLKNTSPITALYSSGANAGFDLRYRMLAAINLCYALKTIHSMNQVCGDLNPQNICINLDENDRENVFHVTLVDTDSYHFSTDDMTYRCEVGLSDYIAPEIQKKITGGVTLKTAELPTYTRESDLFALAVHIFALLMNGCHPFACAKEGAGGISSTIEQMKNTTIRDSVVAPQPIENIKDGFFPFNQSRPGITIPIYAPEFSSLPLGIQNLFIRTFELGYENPKCRVSTEEWIEELSKYISPDKYSKCDNKHYFFSENGTKCPFCAVNENIAAVIGKGFVHTGKGSNDGDSIGLGSNTGSGTGTGTGTGTGHVSTSSGSGGGTSNQGSGKDKKIRKIAIITLAAIAIALIIFFIVYYTNNSTDNQTQKLYSEYMENADNYLVNNDPDAACSEYEAAIRVSSLIDASEVYLALADIYLSQYSYDDAEDILTEAKSRDNVSDENIDKIENKLITISDEKEKFEWEIENLEELYNYLNDKNYKGAYEKLVEMCEEDSEGMLSIYYKDGQLYSDIEDGKYLYVDYYYDNYYMYYGQFYEGEQSGTGIEVGDYKTGYYYIDGSFQDGYANGKCVLYYSDNEFVNGTKYSLRISGNFTDGYEDGVMALIYYYEDGKTEKFTRTSDMGTFEVLSVENGKYIYANNGESILYYYEESGLEYHGCPNKK